MIELEVMESGPIELEIVTASADPGHIPVLIDKTITVNGVYQASSDDADGYREVTANVPNTYTAGDEGKVVDNGALVNQTARTITSNGTYDTTKNNSVTASVPNTYTAGDEGKVVDGGALVSQTSATYTTNDTYDTTLINEVTVNVSGGWDADDVGTGTYPDNLAVTYTESTLLFTAFYHANITSFYAPNVEELDDSLNGILGSNSMVFHCCTALTRIDMPVLKRPRDYFARQCTSLTSVNLPEITYLGSYNFYGCTSLPSFVGKKVQTMYQRAFEGCSSLDNVDILGGTGSGALAANVFNGCTNLKTLVIRNAAVMPLANINAFANSPFKSGGSGGTLYVPQSVLTSYQSATNWSTILGYANNQIKSIESTHTDPDAPIDLTIYYADGSEI